MNARRIITMCCTMVALAAAAQGTPPSIPNPYVVKSYRVYPAPEIDKWSTMEITVKCEGEPEPSLRLFVKASGIELELPVPVDIPESELKSMKHGVPYPLAMSGKEGQLPTWKNMPKGSERTYSFRFRPYWYGKLGIDILNAGFIYFIGIGEDGRSTFAGTAGELEAIVGKPQTPLHGDPNTLIYSDEQCDQQGRLLAKRKPGLHIIRTDREYIISGLGQGNILRQDYFVPRDMRKSDNRSLSVRILSRSRENELPEFMPVSAADCALVGVKEGRLVFDKTQDGFHSGTVEISTTKDEVQGALFRVRYPWTSDEDASQMPIYGVRLRFGGNNELISVE
jgi:hypothetical protein